MKKNLVLNAVINNSIEWRKHALIRMSERNITRSEVKQALLQGEIIEEYPDDEPFPSALFSMNVHGKQVHVVVALDQVLPKIFIITAYTPTLDKFEQDYKTRKIL